MKHKMTTRNGDQIDPDVLNDLKQKQELLSAACQCLEDQERYVFFENLAEIAKQSPEEKARVLDAMETLGAYDPHDLGVIRRLVMGDGALAFKRVVDMVREIRVQQEIDSMIE